MKKPKISITEVKGYEAFGFADFRDATVDVRVEFEVFWDDETQPNIELNSVELASKDFELELDPNADDFPYDEENLIDQLIEQGPLDQWYDDAKQLAADAIYDWIKDEGGSFR